MENLIKIPIHGKVITLKYEQWDGDVDIDEITKIDYSNLYGELVTISALLNRVGILKADVDNQLSEYKLDCQIFESSKRKEFITAELVLGKKKPSEDTITHEINCDPEVISKRKRLNQYERDANYIAALYWAVQSKDKKLSVLLRGITPEEFANNIVEGVVNSFSIKKFDTLL